MKEVKVNKFCCCISLRTGCFIIGWLQLILSCGIIIAATIDIHLTSRFGPRPVSDLLYGIPTTFIAIRMLVGLHMSNDKYFKEYVTVMTFILSALFGYLFVSMLSPLLFNNVNKDKNLSERNIIPLVLFCMHSYFIIVVNSYKAQLSRLDTPDKPNAPDTRLDV